MVEALAELEASANGMELVLRAGFLKIVLVASDDDL